MTSKRPMSRNKLLTAGKNKTELNDFLKEDKNETLDDTEDANDSSEVELETEVVIAPKKNPPAELTDIEKEADHKGSIFLKVKKTPIEKKNVTYYLKKENIEKIESLAGKGKGKSGYNKSELVDILLEEAFNMLKLK